MREGGAEEVPDPVRQPDVGMEVGDRRASGDARKAVGGGDRDRLVGREDDADVRIVERGVEDGSLGAARAGEEQIDPPGAQDLEDRMGAAGGSPVRGPLRRRGGG